MSQHNWKKAPSPKKAEQKYSLPPDCINSVNSRLLCGLGSGERSVLYFYTSQKINFLPTRQSDPFLCLSSLFVPRCLSFCLAGSIFTICLLFASPCICIYSRHFNLYCILIHFFFPPGLPHMCWAHSHVDALFDDFFSSVAVMPTDTFLLLLPLSFLNPFFFLLSLTIRSKTRLFGGALHILCVSHMKAVSFCQWILSLFGLFQQELLSVVFFCVRRGGVEKAAWLLCPSFEYFLLHTHLHACKSE